MKQFSRKNIHVWKFVPHSAQEQEYDLDIDIYIALLNYFKGFSKKGKVISSIWQIQKICQVRCDSTGCLAMPFRQYAFFGKVLLLVTV